MEGIILYDFMCKDLGLKGCELLVYAVIHDYWFCGGYSGSLKQLEEKTGYRQAHICSVLKKLVDKGYVRKTVINKHCIKYRTTWCENLKG